MNERAGTESPAILVIEPDPELRRYLHRCLASFSPSMPRILEAETVEQAVSVLEDGGIDLVIGVLNGAGRDGPDLCALLGVGDRGQVPVLLLATGVSSVGEVRSVRSLASTTVLPGTPSASRLCRTVELILAPDTRTLLMDRPVTPPASKGPVVRREEE